MLSTVRLDDGKMDIELPRLQKYFSTIENLEEIKMTALMDDLRKALLRVGETVKDKTEKLKDKDKLKLIKGLLDPDNHGLPEDNKTVADKGKLAERLKGVLGAVYQLYLADKSAEAPRIAWALTLLAMAKALNSLPGLQDVKDKNGKKTGCKLLLWEPMGNKFNEQVLDEAKCKNLAKALKEIQAGITKCDLFAKANVDELAKVLADIYLG